MPIYEVTDPKTGRTLELEGDSAPTEQELDQIFSQYQIERQATTGEKLGGAIDVGFNMLSSAAAKPLSGLYGAATLATTFDPARAAASQKQAEDVLTHQLQEGSQGQKYAQAIANAPIIKQIGEVFESGSQQIGDATYNVTGSPLAASVAKAAPEAFATYLGGKAPAGQAPRFERKANELAQQGAGDMVRNTATDIPTALRSSDTAQALRSGKTKDIADIIDADPEFYKALEDLGITSEPLPSYASRNPQFRGIEQSFAAIPNSPQHTQALQFSKDVSALAHGLQEKFTKFEGSADASMQFRQAAEKTVDELTEAADEAYGLLDARLNKRAVAQPKETMKFINEATQDLAGSIDDPDLPSSIKTVLKSLEPRRVTNPDGTVMLQPPTYANLDLVRREIGAGLKKEGQFKDEQTGLLKKLYSTITDDLHNMAEAQGLVDEVKASKALVKQRKDLETSMQQLLGKNLQNDIIPVIQSGAKGLAKGGVEKYQRIMQNLDPELRKELVFTAISDQFRKTLQGSANQLDTTAFLKWYDQTLGNKTVRGIIEQDLPEGALADIDNLAKISRGIAQASAQKIKTGIVNAVLKDEGGFLERMVGKGAKVLPGATGKTLSIVEDLLAKKSDRAAATSDLLADPQFQSLLRNSVANGVAQGKRLEKAAAASEKRVMQSEKYKRWAETLSESERAKLAGAGLASFLINQNEEPQQ
jgi:hypothetical protein